MTWNDNQRLLKDGSVGIIKSDLGSDLKTSTACVNKAMTWLQQNNPLYSNFIPQGEMIHPYCEQQTVYTNFPGLPW